MQIFYTLNKLKEYSDYFSILMKYKNTQIKSRVELEVATLAMFNTHNVATLKDNNTLHLTAYS